MSETQGRPRCLGLTGGIGSGKSTVAKMFAALGVPVLDLDRVGHQVMADDAVVKRQLIDAFGEGIVDAAGNIDRKTLAARAFVSAEATQQLNAIMHPAIRDRERQWLAAQQAPYAVIEASVLIESGGADRMDRLLVILADMELRRQRVLSRGEMSKERFGDIVARQCSDELRLQYADDVIRNDRSLDALKEQVAKLHGRLSHELGS